MTTINIYDTDDDRIEKICVDRDVTTAELIEALIDAIEGGDIDLDDYL